MRNLYTPRSVRTIIAVVTTALLLAACGGPQSTMEPFGDHAQRIYDLLIPIAWMALGVFIVVEGLLLYTVIRFRRKSNSAIPAQIHGNTQVEILWTIAPALIVLVIAVLTFNTQRLNSVQPADALQVTAVGHQWWFEFQYPKTGAEGELLTATDMYIPVGRPVTVSLVGADVIHNFWIPKLAGKTYMIPNKKNRLSFTALAPGIYRAVCAEFCGTQHAQMRFRVIALEPAKYEAWLNAKRTVPPEAPAYQVTIPNFTGYGTLTGDAARGKAVFLDATNQCITCHAVYGTKAIGNIGPNLTYYGSRTVIGAGVLDYSPENLAKWLHQAYDLKPGNIMSRVITQKWIADNLSDQEIADLVAYLDSMKTDIALPPVK